ncbi:MAG: tellurite resistance TerB family protein [Bacillota bacterium]|nr:tellurite resistance TerB family protein [Bacillota bacterium]
MFLNQLAVAEKEAFIELACSVSQCDGVVCDEEKQMLDSYLHEMNMEGSGYVIRQLPIEEILDIFQNERTKNIVFIEILALVFADGKFDEKEIEVLDKIKQHFGISQEKYINFKEWVKSVNNLYAEGYKLVNE